MVYFKNSLDYATAMAGTTQQSLLYDRYQSYEIFITKKNDVGNRDQVEWQRDSAHSNCCVLPHFPTSKHFVNFPVLSCFQIHLTFMFMTLIYSTTHFSDHPVLSYSTIRLSTTHHSVQQITLQLVYAISYLMPPISLEWRYLSIWENVSCDGKLLQRLLQFIFPMINVKGVLL